MDSHRCGESGQIPQRSNRLYYLYNTWYFHTREGAHVGPFISESEARRGLSDFLNFIALADAATLESFYKSLLNEQ